MSSKQKEITADVSVLAKLFEKFMLASAEAQRELAEKTGTVNGSRSLNAAVLAGFRPQLAYTIAQTKVFRYSRLNVKSRTQGRSFEVYQTSGTRARLHDHV